MTLKANEDFAIDFPDLIWHVLSWLFSCNFFLFQFFSEAVLGSIFKYLKKKKNNFKQIVQHMQIDKLVGLHKEQRPQQYIF